MKKLFTACLILPAFCFAAPVSDNEKLMNSAVKRFDKVYFESGMQGVGAEVRSCYQNAKTDKLYCLYLDYTARIVDSVMTGGMNMSQDQYFDDAAFGERIKTNFYHPRHVSTEDANRHLSELYHKLLQKITEADGTAK